jgi:quercetin dioxygenase-like cupin family protein
VERPGFLGGIHLEGDSMRKLDLVFAVSVVLFFSFPCLAQQPPAKPASTVKPNVIMMAPGDMKYGPLPSWAVSGKPSVENTGTFEVAVLAGNPSKPGLYTVRAHCTDGYKIAPHWHPTPENVTVLQGELSVGMGSQWDSDALKAMPTGAFASVPAGMRHFAQCKGDSVLQIYGDGPLKLNFVSPAPATRATKARPRTAPGQ